MTKLTLTQCDHEWIVFSTALATGSLMVECKECKAFGTVDDPSRKEWKAAFYAPSNPYIWKENKRVTVRSK